MLYEPQALLLPPTEDREGNQGRAGVPFLLEQLDG